MRWKGNRRSHNVEDRRSQRVSGMGGGRGGGLLRLLPMVYRLLGFKGTAIAVVGVVAYGLFSGNLGQILGGGSFQENPSQVSNQPVKQSA